jgi:hypothetical protein
LIAWLHKIRTGPSKPDSKNGRIEASNGFGYQVVIL